MVIDSVLGRNEPKSRITGFTALWGTIAAIVSVITLWDRNLAPSFNNMIKTSQFRFSFDLVFLVVAGLTVLVAIYWTQDEDLPSGEFFALLMFATTGMLLMAAANDLVIIFLGLETVSITTYVLAGYRRTDSRSNEASMKYFILGSFSTAFLLYGIALTYGATKTTNLAGIQKAIHAAGGLTSEGLLFVGAAMMFIGFAFKVATAPFHVWTPDVYEGAPSPVTGFMASGPKAAAFAAFLLVFAVAFYDPAISGARPEDITVANNLTEHWIRAMTVVAVLTMTLGNVVAMVQNNIKRMLAYSSIAHAGYALVGFLAGDWKSVVFYMMSYSILTIGAFAVITLIARKDDRLTSIDDYAGIGFKSLGLSLTFALFMASLAGFPLTAGFMGKFLVFKAAWAKDNLHPVVIVAVLNSAASVYYYLRPLVKMFFSESEQTYEPARIPVPIVVTLVITVVGTLYLGIIPGTVVNLLSAAR